ncbi:hypothetical protein BH18ACT11_BH18ACT11_12120 [soil metagenome]
MPGAWSSAFGWEDLVVIPLVVAKKPTEPTHYGEVSPNGLFRMFDYGRGATTLIPAYAQPDVPEINSWAGGLRRP